MAEAFKEKFNSEAIAHLANVIARNSESFQKVKFIERAEHGLFDLELKARSNQIKDALHYFMPNDVEQTLDILHRSLGEPADQDTISYESQPTGISGWIIMPVADYVAELTVHKYPDFFDAGLEFMKTCTSRFSAEFAIRLFLMEQPQKTLTKLQQWIFDDNAHVRRLVSEGSRPYLPWGMQLKQFVHEPQQILPLLEQLKDDPSEYVRRSVANNLNDIAKDHPDLVSEIASSWWAPANKPRQQLIKHACRTLIKKGHKKTLALFGYSPIQNKEISIEFNVSESINIGDALDIRCSLHNLTSDIQHLLIDYIVYHVKANAALSPKVFKWKSVSLSSKNLVKLSKSHSFKPVTTRKYYPGKHRVDLQINGEIVATASFDLN